MLVEVLNVVGLLVVLYIILVLGLGSVRIVDGVLYEVLKGNHIVMESVVADSKWYIVFYDGEWVEVVWGHRLKLVVLIKLALMK